MTEYTLEASVDPCGSLLAEGIAECHYTGPQPVTRSSKYMLVIKFFNLAFKHYAVCSGIILVFDINSKIQLKENLKFSVEYIVMLAIESFAIRVQLV
jgi:hypothetical protein